MLNLSITGILIRLTDATDGRRTHIEELEEALVQANEEVSIPLSLRCD